MVSFLPSTMSSKFLVSAAAIAVGVADHYHHSTIPVSAKAMLRKFGRRPVTMTMDDV